MAEREGFEPSRGLAPPYRFSKPTPSATWVPLQTDVLYRISPLLTNSFDLAERVGFEPTVSFPTMVFKTIAIDHSATSPTGVIIAKDGSLGYCKNGGVDFAGAGTF